MNMEQLVARHVVGLKYLQELRPGQIYIILFTDWYADKIIFPYPSFEYNFITNRSFLPYVAVNCLFFDSAHDVLYLTIVYWLLMTSYHCFLWIHLDSKYPPTTLTISKISFLCCLKNIVETETKTNISVVYKKLIFKKVWLNMMQSFSHDKKCKNFDGFHLKASQE